MQMICGTIIHAPWVANLTHCFCTHIGPRMATGSLEPRLSFVGGGGGGGGKESLVRKRAWDILSAHAPKFPEILGIRILP